ncbi:NAD(P)/FAD-dependent oxidoreductase [Rhodococcus fascians]|nr:NAD(P)/FAD-dependent oxidoreductase [Rhodococcus fascians]MBY4136897.1 NAD(P)/FAD-dependent oxidoreductase [Rhodococcus fascians]MBY4218525.1 NAD(P)/FAD-dependent oxidoreductase [Rhodococcus fascians]MBY4221559.1 NAD(P)/FAD-dependent oxidoreductase [Rhodococcus fascians]MBY4232440.1 NAD(P)/FAD-dependent oxidoreductase [Rhodococcus fascians]
MTYDTVVIGGGPAGLSAATLLARARRKVIVVDAEEPRNAPADHLHNFLSRDGSTPEELHRAGCEEVLRYGGEILRGRVIGLDEGFEVRLEGGESRHSRSALVATGLRDELPDIPGVHEQWGSGALHCPYCHGYEVRDQPIAVVGGSNRPFTIHQASLIRQWSDDVVFFTNGIELSENERLRLDARSVGIVDVPVARIVVQDGRVIGIELTNGTVVPRTVVFVGPTFVPNDALLRSIGCTRLDNGWVATDPTGLTSVDGLWAAGNVSDSPAQLINSAAAGSKAAIAINHYLLELDVTRAVSAV